MDAERIAAIKARVESASEGPWYATYDPGFYGVTWEVSNKQQQAKDSGVAYGSTRADAEFVAESRQDVPDLVDEVERLRETLRDALTPIQAIYGSPRWVLEGPIKADFLTLINKMRSALGAPPLTA